MTDLLPDLLMLLMMWTPTADDQFKAAYQKARRREQCVSYSQYHASHRHFILHLSEPELYHRCLAGNCAAGQELPDLFMLRGALPTAYRRPYRAI